MAKMWGKNTYQVTKEDISWQEQRELARFTARKPQEPSEAEAKTGG